MYFYISNYILLVISYSYYFFSYYILITYLVHFLNLRKIMFNKLIYSIIRYISCINTAIIFLIIFFLYLFLNLILISHYILLILLIFLKLKIYLFFTLNNLVYCTLYISHINATNLTYLTYILQFLLFCNMPRFNH